MAIGYACVTIGVEDTGLCKCVLRKAEEANLSAVISSNLKALEKMIDYNIANGIKLFRISSDIIPFASHPVNKLPWWSDYEEQFHILKDKLLKSGMRVSMHPGQYTVLNSPEKDVVERAVSDLIYHDRLLTALGMENSKLVLHVGGIYGDKRQAVQRFLYNYRSLSQELKDRIILENDDRNYTIQDVLEISGQTGAPVVFDQLHHRVNPSEYAFPDAYWIEESGRTWRRLDGKQKLHYSQQKKGGNAGAHSDTIYLAEFLDYYDQLPDQEVDIMLEVKDKNLSAIKCINGILNRTGKELEAEWARYQYYVLGKSEKAYQEIKRLMDNKELSVVREFYDLIETAASLPRDIDAEVKAATQVWEYMRKDSTPAERKRYEKLLEAVRSKGADLQPVKNHLLKCAKARGIPYLLQALYFYL